ncbi:hypothetical protein Poli38472_002250 [Pythium oligandrum]|uniref:Feruloyl esterase n=1 Tax=Pythium oligandrum TaxID=41045 RepID=A0A8K1CGV5_PYTOL|nr:hypothetical protein Poli38472_002250 [Pythium oligandrum]|eukprot:TMW63309.1 hypothetical protein Poli38472_002250 [Pythium oligandrum]
MPSKTSLLGGLLVAITSLLATQVHATFLKDFSEGCFRPATIKSGKYNVTVNGTVRQYSVRVPDNYNPFNPYRVVLALHWFGGTIDDLEKNSTKYGNGTYYGLQTIAGDTAIFVAPQGIETLWMNTNGEDLALVDELIKIVDKGLCVDQSRRLAVGFSFGGSMAHAIANTRARVFRAVAILSGNDFTPFTGESLPVSVYVQHGVRDPGVNNPITQGRAMRDRFVKLNGCIPKDVEEPQPGSMSHIKTEYNLCFFGHQVTYIAFDGIHEFSPVDSGKTSSWAPLEIWKFFLTAPRPTIW